MYYLHSKDTNLIIKVSRFINLHNGAGGGNVNTFHGRNRVVKVIRSHTENAMLKWNTISSHFAGNK